METKTPPQSTDADALATRGLGSRWRLTIKAVKHVDCPRCGTKQGMRCVAGRTCGDRVWLYAARLRRERANLTVDNIANIRAGVDDGRPDSKALAISCGLLRLVTGPDGTPAWRRTGALERQQEASHDAEATQAAATEEADTTTNPPAPLAVLSMPPYAPPPHAQRRSLVQYLLAKANSYKISADMTEGDEDMQPSSKSLRAFAALCRTIAADVARGDDLPRDSPLLATLRCEKCRGLGGWCNSTTDPGTPCEACTRTGSALFADVLG